MFSYLNGQADPDNQRPDNWSYTVFKAQGECGKLVKIYPGRNAALYGVCATCVAASQQHRKITLHLCIRF
jgi:hypothetical protein